jgi:molybdate transport system ATP-binding protein
MTLAVDVAKSLGDFSLTATFTAPVGVTALFGRSGAGKTTLVNLIAGLLRPDRGAITLDGTVLTDTGRRLNVPAHRRQVGYVFQEGRLFPHLSVKGNLAYGYRAGRPHDRSLDEVVALLGIGALLDRRPAALSGGEKQRVAIGRALLCGPRLLLMDEPLASLDAPRRAEILPYIERLRDDLRLPIVYVSHSLDEVMRLADTVVLLADGKVAAVGNVNAVFARLDLRPLTGRLDQSVVIVAPVVANNPASGTTTLSHPAGQLSVPLLQQPVGTLARLRIRAPDVALAVGEPGKLSIRNRLAATIAEIAEGTDAIVDVRLDAAGTPLLARITLDAAKSLNLTVGQPVVALIKATAFDRSDDLA